MKKNVTLILALLLVGSLLTACDGGSSALIGKWEHTESGLQMEFIKDGTFTANVSGTEITGKWKVTKSELYVTLDVKNSDASSTGWKFRVSGSTLEFSDPDSGEITKYTRVK